MFINMLLTAGTRFVRSWKNVAVDGVNSVCALLE